MESWEPSMTEVELAQHGWQQYKVHAAFYTRSRRLQPTPLSAVFINEIGGSLEEYEAIGEGGFGFVDDGDAAEHRTRGRG